MAPARSKENTSVLFVQVVCNVLWDLLRWEVFVTAVQLRNVLGSNYHLPTVWRVRKPMSSGKLMTTISGHKFQSNLDWDEKTMRAHLHGSNSNYSIFNIWMKPMAVLFPSCSSSIPSMISALSASLQWGSFVLSDSWMGQKFCSCDLSILDRCQSLQPQGSFCKDKGLWSHKYTCSLEWGYYPIKPFILLMKRAWSMSNRQ